MLLIFPLFAACSQGGREAALTDLAVAQAVEQSVAATLEAAPTATPTKPAVIIVEPTEPPSSITLLTVEEVTALAPTQTSLPTETAVAPSDAETNTPAPTFTPPSLPFTSAEEHFWFRRPVPDGTAVWTDKAYPYGSNRGGALRTHHGVEFNVDYNTQVLSAASGTIIFAGSDADVALGPHPDFYGNVIVIEHKSRWQGDPVFTLYGHLNAVEVTVGQEIGVLDPIGLSGASGTADGPHLHFEVRVGENSYSATRNPLLWLYPFPDKAVVAGRITYPDGSPANATAVELIRVDAKNRYQATTTYVDTAVNPDPEWNENFVIDDVDPGFYEVVVRSGSKKYKTEVWVYPYRTSFVEIVVGE